MPHLKTDLTDPRDMQVSYAILGRLLGVTASTAPASTAPATTSTADPVEDAAATAVATAAALEDLRRRLSAPLRQILQRALAYDTPTDQTTVAMDLGRSPGSVRSSWNSGLQRAMKNTAKAHPDAPPVFTWQKPGPRWEFLLHPAWRRALTDRPLV